MRDYHQLIDAGTAAQLEKLKENEHKNGFDSIDIDYAYGRLKEEMEELNQEFHWKENFPAKYDLIRREAADVANFAHMIILRCDKELAKKC